MYKYVFMVLVVSWSSVALNAIELVIGKERVEPGIVFIFEGAIKDHVVPLNRNISEKNTNVHIEARANWDTKRIPEGTPAGGFVPYLHISAELVNERTGISSFIDLIPHINLIDNFHYARNVSLPGAIDDPYTVTFHILQPTRIDLSLHKDWLDRYGESLVEDKSFKYRRINFEKIAKASR